MEFSKNYGQIIIGYGLLSIGITLVMLFMQTSGIFWLILAGAIIVGGIWIIKKEKNDRKKFQMHVKCKILYLEYNEVRNLSYHA